MSFSGFGSELYTKERGIQTFPASYFFTMSALSPAASNTCCFDCPIMIDYLSNQEPKKKKKPFFLKFLVLEYFITTSERIQGSNSCIRIVNMEHDMQKERQEQTERQRRLRVGRTISNSIQWACEEVTNYSQLEQRPSGGSCPLFYECQK